MKALVTGAGDGIGGAIASALVRDAIARGDDAAVCLTASGRRPQPDRLMEDLRTAGADVRYVSADLERGEDCTALARAAVEGFGGLDTLIHSAAILAHAPLRDIGLDAWDRSFAVNVRALLALGQAVYPALAQSRGAIVAVSSLAGQHPHPGAGAYAPSKAALDMLVRQLAQEWGSDGIRVNAVIPGMIRTPLTERNYSTEGDRQARNRLVPLGRTGVPADVAELAAFLASPRAEYVTGQIVAADGGFGGTLLSHMPSAASSTANQSSPVSPELLLDQ